MRSVLLSAAALVASLVLAGTGQAGWLCGGHSCGGGGHSCGGGGVFGFGFIRGGHSCGGSYQSSCDQTIQTGGYVQTGGCGQGGCSPRGVCGPNGCTTDGVVPGATYTPPANAPAPAPIPVVPGGISTESRPSVILGPDGRYYRVVYQVVISR
jgi:hypothetical protein